MQRRLDEAMDAGAYGYSTGLVYPPSAYAPTEELVLLARSMARRGGLYFSHVRGESAMVEDSIREAIRIGEETGVGVQIAHVKVGGRENWGKMDRVLRLIDRSEEHTSELQSRLHLVCRLLLEKKKAENEN